MYQITLEFKNDSPLYTQLYDYIRIKIEDNTIKANEKLPSKRILAKHLSISINSVIKAYAILENEGYIYTLPNVGYFASNLNVKIKQTEKIKIKETKKEIIYSYDFSTSNIDISTFPFFSWRKVAKEILLYEDASVIQKTSFKGDYSLRLQIQKNLLENKDLNVDIDNIYIGCGIEYLLGILLKTINIESVSIENPGYLKIANVFTNNNVLVKHQSVDEYGLIINNNLSTDSIYVTPENQFPTGVKMSMERKSKLIEYVLKNSTIIFEDNFDSEFKIKGYFNTPLIKMCKEKVVFLSTFSRTISPALRISYMIVPKEISKLIDLKYNTYTNTVPTFEQKVLASFMEQGFYERHLNKVKNIYRKKRNLIIDLLKKTNDFIINTDDSYLSLLVNYKYEIDLISFKKDLIKSSINMSFLCDFYFSNTTTQTLIIGYTGININQIGKGIDLLITLLNNNKIDQSK